MPSFRSSRTIRRAIQFCFTASCLYAGWRFLCFLDWTTGSRAAFTPRPAAIEGFLPIAALAGFKRLILTGSYDPVHPAGLTILLAAICGAFLFRKNFCGAVCPVGLASEFLGEAGKRIGLARSAPRFLDRWLGLIKYVFLAFFLASIFLFMDEASIRSFQASAYNLTADAHLLTLFTRPSATFLCVIGLLALAGLVFRNAWCRWLCPYGALLGLMGRAGPCSIQRDSKHCDGCGACRRACPVDIAPGRAARSTLCVACGQCVQACPNPGTLTLKFLRKPVPASAALVGGAAFFVGACLLAVFFGLWDSALPPHMLRALYAAALR
jgi:polyferredoxin